MITDPEEALRSLLNKSVLGIETSEDGDYVAFIFKHGAITIFGDNLEFSYDLERELDS